METLEPKRTIRRIDDDSGARFYEGVEELPDGGEKQLFCYPSVTHILDTTWPKDPYLIAWIREHGKEGEGLFEQAGEDGTAIHIAIDRLLAGEKVETSQMNKKVKKCVQAFCDWHKEFKPEDLGGEKIVVNNKLRYAGCLDRRFRLDYKKGKTRYKGVYTVDFKSSKSVHDVHKAQVAGYQRACSPKDKTAILHLGNRTNAGYSFLEFKPAKYWAQFKNACKMFYLMNPEAKPTVITFPDFFIL